MTSQQMDAVDRWFSGDSAGARAFQESLDAGGVIRNDLLKVAASLDGVMECGLTRDALILLIQGRCPNGRNGKPMPKATIVEVLTAMGKLREYIKPQFLPKAGR